MEAWDPEEVGDDDAPPLRPHVTEGEKTRLVAWSDELRHVHARLREALVMTQEAVARGDPEVAASR